MSELVHIPPSGDPLEIHPCAYAIIEQAAWLERTSLLADLDTQAIVPESFRAQPKLFPVLLDLKALDVEQRADLSKLAAAWALEKDVPYFSALLDTTASSVQIAAHLARRMLVSVPGAGQDVLRFYDPFVFRHLQWLLTPKQRDSLLGPIQRWNWREPNGTWRSYKREAAHASVPPLLLKPEQWPTLMRLTDINAMLRRLARVAPQLHDDDVLATRIDTLLAEAWLQHQMADRQDRYLYAEQALRFHPDIHSHPQSRQRLERTRAGGTSYVSACAGVDDAAWRDLASRLPSRNPSFS